MSHDEEFRHREIAVRMARRRLLSCESLHAHS